MANTERSIGVRWLLTVEGQPLHNAKITISHLGVIREIVAEARQHADQDVGEFILLPQLVNAHTHLEFSNLRQPVGFQGIKITDWIPQVIGARAQRGTNDHRTNTRMGMFESRQFATIAIADIATAMPHVIDYDDRMFVNCFFERLGSHRHQFGELLDEAQVFLRSMPLRPPVHLPRMGAGLSPHAPYSVHGELFKRMVKLATENSLPLAMHLAESREELEWLDSGGGAFSVLLDSLGAWSEGPMRGDFHKPLHFLQLLAGLKRALIVHGNYLVEEELDFVARFPQRLYVVFCPRTHAYFHHEPYPLGAMLDRRIRVAVGTDSRASNPDLSVWRELKRVRQTHPELEPGSILRLGTINGAQALGLDHLLGSVAVGKRSHFALVPVDRTVSDPCEYLFDTELEPTSWQEFQS